MSCSSSEASEGESAYVRATRDKIEPWSLTQDENRDSSVCEGAITLLVSQRAIFLQDIQLHV